MSTCTKKILCGSQRRRMFNVFHRRFATKATSVNTSVKAKLFVPIGAFAGVMGAFCGLGGAVVLVPTLSSLTTFAPHLVAGTSVFCNTFSASVGATSYLKQGVVDIPAAVCLTVAGAVAAAIGARLSGQLSGSLLKKVTGGFLLCSVPAMVQKRKLGSTRLDAAHPSQQFSLTTHWPYLAAGFGGGFLSGLIGVGSGVVMMAYMSSNFCDLDQHTAVATSLAATVPMGLVSTGMHMMKGNVSLNAAAIICAALGTAMLGASMYAKSIDEKTLRYFFAVLVTVSSMRMIIR